MCPPNSYLAPIAMGLINDTEIFFYDLVGTYKVFKSTKLMVNIGPGYPRTMDSRTYLKTVDSMTEDPRTMDPGTQNRGCLDQ